MKQRMSKADKDTIRRGVLQVLERAFLDDQEGVAEVSNPNLPVAVIILARDGAESAAKKLRLIDKVMRGDIDDDDYELTVIKHGEDVNNKN